MVLFKLWLGRKNLATVMAHLSSKKLEILTLKGQSEKENQGLYGKPFVESNDTSMVVVFGGDVQVGRFTFCTQQGGKNPKKGFSMDSYLKVINGILGKY